MSTCRAPKLRRAVPRVQPAAASCRRCIGTGNCFLSLGTRGTFPADRPPSACPPLPSLLHPLPVVGSRATDMPTASSGGRRAAPVSRTTTTPSGLSPPRATRLNDCENTPTVQAAKPVVKAPAWGAPSKPVERASRRIPSKPAAAAKPAAKPAQEPVPHEGSRLPSLKTAPAMQSQVGAHLAGCWSSLPVLPQGQHLPCPPTSYTPAPCACAGEPAAPPRFTPAFALPQEILGAMLADLHSAGPDDMLIASARTAHGARAGGGRRSTIARVAACHWACCRDRLVLPLMSQPSRCPPGCATPHWQAAHGAAPPPRCPAS